MKIDGVKIPTKPKCTQMYLLTVPITHLKILKMSHADLHAVNISLSALIEAGLYDLWGCVGEFGALPPHLFWDQA